MEMYIASLGGDRPYENHGVGGYMSNPSDIIDEEDIEESEDEL
jgi:hypothetical protein